MLYTHRENIQTLFCVCVWMFSVCVSIYTYIHKENIRTHLYTIYISHQLRDCLVLSQLFSVKRHRCFKLGSKPNWLYVRAIIIFCVSERIFPYIFLHIRYWQPGMINSWEELHTLRLYIYIYIYIYPPTYTNHYYYYYYYVVLLAEISMTLLPFFSIFHCFWQVYYTTSCVGTELS